jgi:hypothetical protein
MKIEGCIVGIEIMPNANNIVLIFILFCDYILSIGNLIDIVYTIPIKGAFKVSLHYNVKKKQLLLLVLEQWPTPIILMGIGCNARDFMVAMHCDFLIWIRSPTGWMQFMVRMEDHEDLCNLWMIL